jgi:hypothetical protein
MRACFIFASTLIVFRFGSSATDHSPSLTDRFQFKADDGKRSSVSSWPDSDVGWRFLKAEERPDLWWQL